jgi:RNA polymerase sigma-70 factor (ECF subfamily)
MLKPILTLSASLTLATRHSSKRSAANGRACIAIARALPGSVLDGEDVMQEALFEAYRKLDSFDDSRPLGPWLFRIAHNRCIDFLRRRRVREETETTSVEPDLVLPADPVGPALGRAIERLVIALPPKERACVLLKDVF